jgi:hypothetical protein
MVKDWCSSEHSDLKGHQTETDLGIKQRGMSVQEIQAEKHGEGAVKSLS